MPTVTIAITSGTRWRVPADCSSATIEIIGAGSAGGGAYSKTNTISLTPLSLVYINIATGAQNIPVGTYLGDTWFNKASNAAPSSTTNGCLAKGGFGYSAASTTAPGGQSSGGVGDVKYSGGAGWNTTTSAVLASAGGAAGPNGNGGNGYQGAGRGGGGGANGGGNGQAESGGIGGAGGTNRFGSGSGAGGNTTGTSGTNGGGGGGTTGAGSAGGGSVEPIWTDYLGNSYGPASGTGGSGNAAGTCCCSCQTIYVGYPNATNYGGGGFWGSSGLIIITYTPTVSIGTTYTEVLNEEGVTDGQLGLSYPYTIPKRKWRIPYGVENVTVHCIAAGGSVSNSYAGTPVGGGGAYASSTLSITGAENNTDATYILATNYFNSGFSTYIGNTWVSKTSNAPTTTTEGALAAFGNPGGISFAGSIPGAGGSASNSIGTVKYSGGNGGTTRGTANPGKRGGGGGAAGPNGNGASGGSAFNSTGNGPGGGGGGANGGGIGGNGASGTTSAGGAGGTNRFGTGSGAGGPNSSTPAGSGSSGGGGGGGYASRVGGQGSYEAIWTDSGTGNIYGPGSGTGGHGTNYTSVVDIFKPYYGGGSSVYGGGTRGSDPLIVLVYTITKAAPVDATATGNMFMMF